MTRPIHDMNMQRATIGLALLFPAICAGCKAVGFIAPIAGVSATYVATSISHGPRVQFMNDSAVPLRVRYWVGRRDIMAPGGVADIRTDEGLYLDVRPGDFFITQLGRPFWPTGNSDAVVWARIDTATAQGEPRDPVWLDLVAPGPYVWRATGQDIDSLVFERDTGTIKPLPPSRWIDGNNGEHPVYALR